MACYYCRHFNLVEEAEHIPGSGGAGIVKRINDSKGQCTLTPTWETVSGLHYCSKFSPTRAKDVGHWWQSMHELNDMVAAERKRRLEAEKKLKQIRKDKA